MTGRQNEIRKAEEEAGVRGDQECREEQQSKREKLRVRGRGRAKGRGRLRRKIKCPIQSESCLRPGRKAGGRIHLRKIMLLEFVYPDLSGQSEIFRTRHQSEGVSVPGSPR